MTTSLRKTRDCKIWDNAWVIYHFQSNFWIMHGLVLENWMSTRNCVRQRWDDISFTVSNVTWSWWTKEAAGKQKLKIPGDKVDTAGAPKPVKLRFTCFFLDILTSLFFFASFIWFLTPINGALEGPYFSPKSLRCGYKIGIIQFQMELSNICCHSRMLFVKFTHFKN